MTPAETMAPSLSTGPGKSDTPMVSQQNTRTETACDESVKRYEKLTSAAKAFIFTVLVEDGHAVCTIHYPGVFQVTGYTEEEYAADPLLWFQMVHAEDHEIVLGQIAQLLQGETPSPFKHRIWHKDGTLCWVRNTSVPVFDSTGKLVAYDGMVVDISLIQSVQAKEEQQIAELSSALAMIKSLHTLLPICCSCKKIRDDEGYWQQIDAYISGHFESISFTHGICPTCAQKLYPQLYKGQTLVV